MKSALCILGSHSGEWSLPSARCESVRHCDHCGRHEERVRHVWGPFGYEQVDRCDQIRSCERCGSTETRTVHDWGSWFYESNAFDARQVRTCRRCHEKEMSGHTMR